MISTIYFGYCEENNSPEKVIPDFGTTPIISGIIEKTEWQDAKKTNLNSTKFILLKHDNKNLYFAFNGDGGNIYFLKGKKVVILHASLSLGSAEYSKLNNQKWSCIKEYQWALSGLQKKAENEIRSEITGYLHDNGWVASLIPMGNRQQSELAVSFQ